MCVYIYTHTHGISGWVPTYAPDNITAAPASSPNIDDLRVAISTSAASHLLHNHQQEGGGFTGVLLGFCFSNEMNLIHFKFPNTPPF